MKKYNVKHYKDFNCIYFDRSSGEYRDCILKAENEKQAKEVCENIFGNCWKVVFVK